jgi:hypothetical protein
MSFVDAIPRVKDKIGVSYPFKRVIRLGGPFINVNRAQQPGLAGRIRQSSQTKEKRTRKYWWFTCL